MTEGRRATALWLTAIAVAYGAAHQLGLMFVDPTTQISTVWPASGVGLAALLLTQRSERWRIYAVLSGINLAANLLVGASAVSALGALSSNLLELVLASWCIQRANTRITFEQVREVTALLCAATFGCMLASAVGAGTTTLVHGVGFWRAQVTWWIADGLGMLLVAPLAVAWFRVERSSAEWRGPKLFEQLAFLLVWVAVAFLAFNRPLRVAPGPYVLLALLAWPALRLGQRWVTLALGVLAVTAILSTQSGEGHAAWGGRSVHERLLLLQTYLGFACSSALLFAASVSERRRAEQASREAEARSYADTERLAIALDAASMGTWEWHMTTNATFWSPNIDAILARPLGSFARTFEAYMALVNPADRVDVEQTIAAVLERGSGDYTSEHRIVGGDGVERWMLSKGRLDCDASGKPFRLAGTLVDISQRKQAEQRSGQLQEQLRQVQKLEALGTLAGGIAHDFNNILSAIVAYTQIAQLDNPDHVELQSQLAEVMRASSRAANLVQQILSFGRRQRQERKTCSLSPVFKEALTLLRSTLPATIEIREDLAPDLPEVLADPTQIHQVLMNLCTNASHAMKGRGELRLELSRYRLATNAASPHVELRPGNYLRLTVTDNGAGMDEAVLSRVFEPFFTTKGLGEGSGLGLAVAHGIVKEHEGIITVNSQPGQGTTFSVYLPAVASAEPLVDDALANIPRGDGEHVLFVDDEGALCAAARHILTRLGYRPHVFQDSEAAWQAFRAAPGGFDVLVTDLTMPARTGLDLADDVMRLRPDLPVILASGYSATLTSERLEELGIRELLVKPIDYRTLATALARALPRRLGKTA